MAGISVEYCIRLEQARGPKPSRQVLGALTRALVLDRDQRAHLFHLADVPPETSAPSREVPRAVVNLLAGLSDFPAYAVNAGYDMLAWNRLAEVFMGYPSELGFEQRNMLRTSFTGSGPPSGWPIRSSGVSCASASRTCAPASPGTPVTRNCVRSSRSG